MSEIKSFCDWLIKTSPVDQLLELLPSPSPSTALCQNLFLIKTIANGGEKEKKKNIEITAKVQTFFFFYFIIVTFKILRISYFEPIGEKSYDLQRHTQSFYFSFRLNRIYIESIGKVI